MDFSVKAEIYEHPGCFEPRCKVMIGHRCEIGGER
jgi:hypothetical protein